MKTTSWSRRFNEASKPSLYGKNISTYSLELTPEGTAVFESALQGNGGAISVLYDLWFWAKLPPFQVTGSFRSTAFYSYFQDVDVDKPMWSENTYRETLSETLRESEALQIVVKSDAQIDPKVKDQVVSWVTRMLEDAVDRKLKEALPTLTDDERKPPEDVNDFVRNIQKAKIASFTVNYNEQSAVEWNAAPNGTLPNITSMKDKNGNQIQWANHAMKVDANSAFFEEINVAAHINADFNALPLNSVEIKLAYNGKPMNPGEGRFTGPNDVEHFRTFIEGDNSKYQYSYQINFTGQSRIYQSDLIETDENILTIGVGDTGILDILVAPGDLDFNQVAQAHVTLQYEDSSHGVNPIEEQFTLTQDSPQHHFQKVIFEPVHNPYQYKVKYFMKDGKEFQTDWVADRSKELFINDPFTSNRTISIRAAGDLKNDIENIFIDLTYLDDDNHYIQEKSMALNSGNPFFDWTFPVIKEQGGVISYSGQIIYSDGEVESIPQTILSSSTIILRPANILAVDVVADLLDFAQVKLCKVDLRYHDQANNLSKQEDFLFRKDDGKLKTWQVRVKDPNKLDYEWKADFFMVDGTHRSTDWTSNDESTLILELPVVEHA